MPMTARRNASGNNERQDVLACLVYANDHDAKWPATIEELATAKDIQLPKTVYSSPSAPELAAPYLYVRPTSDAPATQPVIVEDPACNRGRGSMVAYGDGHVDFV